MKNYIGILILLVMFGLAGADSYPELMDQAEKLMNRRYEKGSRAYKIKSAELDEILESRETKEGKIARLKKFIAEFQAPGTPRPVTETDMRAQVVAYLRDVKQCEAEAKDGNSAAQFALGLHYWNIENPGRNPRLALEWAQRAAKNGIADASVLVATILLDGGDGVLFHTKEDPAKARGGMVDPGTVTVREGQETFYVFDMEHRIQGYGSAYIRGITSVTRAENSFTVTLPPWRFQRIMRICSSLAPSNTGVAKGIPLERFFANSISSSSLRLSRSSFLPVRLYTSFRKARI